MQIDHFITLAIMFTLSLVILVGSALRREWSFTIVAAGFACFYYAETAREVEWLRTWTSEPEDDLND